MRHRRLFTAISSVRTTFDWLSYLSPIKYAFLALAKNEYKGLQFTCDDEAASAAHACKPYANGDQVLTQLSFDSQPPISLAEGALLIIGTGCLFLSYFALRRAASKY